MTLRDLRDLLVSTGIPVFHFEAHKPAGKYIVWAEDGQGAAAYADNRMIHQSIQGTIDFYTRDEFDPVFDEIQKKLNYVGMPWKLNSIQHEEDTRYIHYEWTFEVVSEIGQNEG